MRGPRLMTAGCRTRRVPWRYGVPILIGWFAGAVALPLADGIGGGLYGNGFLLALIVGQGWPLPLAAMSAYRARRSGARLESPFTWVARQGAILAGLAGGLALARGPLFRGIGRAAWFVTYGEGWAALIVLTAGVEISVAALVLWASIVGIMWADGRKLERRRRDPLDGGRRRSGAPPTSMVHARRQRDRTISPRVDVAYGQQRRVALRRGRPLRRCRIRRTVEMGPQFVYARGIGRRSSSLGGWPPPFLHGRAAAHHVDRHGRSVLGTHRPTVACHRGFPAFPARGPRKRGRSLGGLAGHLDK